MSIDRDLSVEPGTLSEQMHDAIHETPEGEQMHDAIHESDEETSAE